MYKFKCTGKEIYANNGIIGISPDGDVCEGYDGTVDTDDFTKEEKEELADYMIALWEKFKSS